MIAFRRRRPTTWLSYAPPPPTSTHYQRLSVREGAAIGAGEIIGCDLTIGRFAMVGMGSFVTRPRCTIFTSS